MRLTLARPLTLLLLSAALASAGCPKKKDKDKSSDDSTTDGVTTGDLDVRLSIVSISPSTAAVDQPLDATLRGAGFATGAKVYIGVTPASRVEFVSDSSLRIGVPGLPAGRYDVEVQNPDGTSSVLRQGLLVQDDAPACASFTVYFDLDKSNLRSDSIDLLKSQIECLKQQTAPIEVDGHCDERGTTDYNIALGQRRADSVARWLTSNGVVSTRVRTVTFGEERPVDMGHDESAWGKNRRGEIILGR